MQRFTKLTFLLALPLTAGCADDVDNETNASADSADGTATDSADTGTATDPSSPTTDTVDTTATDTTDPTDSDTDSETAPEGCADGDDPNAPRMPLPAEITEPTTLTCDTVWVLTELTTVRGTTLTIDPGTTVVGASSSALVIEKDAQIEAAGTPGGPIVFTSAQPKGQRQRADWGGLILLGRAPVNLPNGVGQAEGFADPPSYGGDDPAHDCGTLQYVRVEWAGFELVTDNELNGITFYACGTDTTVDHVQSHMGSDDAFEWFGGTMNAKYLVATGMSDDGLDCDLGYTGKLQYVFVHQDPADPDANHAMEWSNGPDDFTAQPLTSPWIANLTFIGQGAGGNAAKSHGFVFKEGAEARVTNSYFTNATGFGGSFQDEQTLTVADAGGIVVEGTFWNAHGGFGSQGSGPYSWTDAEWGEWLLGGDGNMDGVDLGLDVTWTAPNIQPASDSAAAGGGVAISDGFFDATTYVGAVDPEGEDWTQASWINYAVD